MLYILFTQNWILNRQKLCFCSPRVCILNASVSTPSHHALKWNHPKSVHPFVGSHGINHISSSSSNTDSPLRRHHLSTSVFPWSRGLPASICTFRKPTENLIIWDIHSPPTPYLVVETFSPAAVGFTLSGTELQPKLWRQGHLNFFSEKMICAKSPAGELGACSQSGFLMTACNVAAGNKAEEDSQSGH